MAYSNFAFCTFREFEVCNACAIKTVWFFSRTFFKKIHYIFVDTEEEVVATKPRETVNKDQFESNIDVEDEILIEVGILKLC